MKRQAEPVGTILANTLLGLATLASASSAEIRAVFVEVEGRVTVASGSASQVRAADRAPVHKALPLQILGGEDEVVIGADSSGVLVCSTEHRVTLVAGSSWRLTEEDCRRGESLPPGTYRGLEPHGGRMHEIEGALILELGTRGPEKDPLIPRLLSPRNTALLDGRPEIVWSAVPGALEVEIRVVGPQSFVVRVPVESATCESTRGGLSESRVCRLPYPANQPSLEQQVSYLTLSAQYHPAGKMLRPQRASRLWVLPPAEAEQLRAEWSQLESLHLPPSVRWILRARSASEKGLYGEAAEAWKAALALLPAPEIEVTLGDLRRRIGLWQEAEDHYRNALQAAVEAQPAVLCAAEAGLGYLALGRGDSTSAVEHFQRALCSARAARIGAVEQLEDALDEARRRSGNRRDQHLAP